MRKKILLGWTLMNIRADDNMLSSTGLQIYCRIIGSHAGGVSVQFKEIGPVPVLYEPAHNNLGFSMF